MKYALNLITICFMFVKLEQLENTFVFNNNVHKLLDIIKK